MTEGERETLGQELAKAMMAAAADTAEAMGYRCLPMIELLDAIYNMQLQIIASMPEGPREIAAKIYRENFLGDVARIVDAGPSLELKSYPREGIRRLG